MSPQSAMLDRLLAIIRRLQAETAGFESNPHDQQAWYNRGYAQGMILALRDLGYGDARAGIEADDQGLLDGGVEVMAWGQAYRHGLETGDKESREVLGPAA